MKSATADQQLTKLAEKVKVSLPLPTPAVLSVKVKKDPPAATAINTLNTSQSSADGDERTFKCDQEGCFSSFKTRSSLRDHQKGRNGSINVQLFLIVFNFSAF